MKKIFLSLAAIAATISIVSCDKDEQPSSEGDVDDVTILALTENVTATKAALIDDDHGYKVVWSKDDAFNLGGQIFSYIGEPGETSGEFEGQLPDEGTYTAFFPASYDGVNWPVHQIYHENGEITFSPMTAEVTVDDDDEAPESIRFRNAGGFLRIYATSKAEVPVKSITVIAPGLDAITLDCSEGVEISNDSTDFFIAMPAGAYKRASILLTDTSDRTCTKIVDIVIKRSGLTAVPFSVEFRPDGALPGKFTVDSKGKQVYFSRGNLQAKYYSDVVAGPKYVWSFAAHQYDHIGNKPGNTTMSIDYRDRLGNKDNAVVDLFGWSTFAQKITYGLCPNEHVIAYYDHYFSGKFLDWGTTIDNKGTWRTLSKDEWTYLVRTHNHRFGVKVMGCDNCMVLYPDGYDIAKMVGDGDKNTYSTEAAYNAATEEGVVFLPPTGNRIGRNVHGANATGLYWTSDPAPGDFNRQAYMFNYSYRAITSSSRHHGHGVRLVSDCK